MSAQLLLIPLTVYYIQSVLKRKWVIRSKIKFKIRKNLWERTIISMTINVVIGGQALQKWFERLDYDLRIFFRSIIIKWKPWDCKELFENKISTFDHWCQKLLRYVVMMQQKLFPMFPFILLGITRTWIWPHLSIKKKFSITIFLYQKMTNLPYYYWEFNC